MASDAYKHYATDGGALRNLNLPAAAAGAGPFRATCRHSQGVSFTAGSGDKIRIYDKLSIAAGKVRSFDPGASLELIGFDADEYIARIVTGEWQVETASGVYEQAGRASTVGHPGVPVNSYVDIMGMKGSNRGDNTFATTNNLEYWLHVPEIPYGTYSEIGIDVQTGLATIKCRVVICTVISGLWSARVYGGAELDCSAAGQPSETGLSFTPIPHQPYFFGAIFNGIVTMYGWNYPNFAAQHATDKTSRANIPCFQRGGTYGAWGANPSTSGYYPDGVMPRIWMKRAS